MDDAAERKMLDNEIRGNHQYTLTYNIHEIQSDHSRIPNSH